MQMSLSYSLLTNRTGSKGLGAFSTTSFKGQAVVELRKPIEGKGKPDTAFLTSVLLKAASEHSKLKSLDSNIAEKWIDVFVEAYFQQTDSALRFEVIRSNYCQQILHIYDAVNFMGIATESPGVDRAGSLADIFVMPNLLSEYSDNPRKRTRLSTDTPQQLPSTVQSPLQKQPEKHSRKVLLSASKLFSQEKGTRAILLGEPGAGKSTLMAYFIVAAVSDSLEASNRDHNHTSQKNLFLDAPCLPISIRIRDLARYPNLSVIEFIQQHAKVTLSLTQDLTGFFEHYLETGSALILLDGVDEVVDLSQRKHVAAKVDAFLRQFSQCAAVIASRPVGHYRQFFSPDNYTCYSLAPFDDSQIDTFIDSVVRKAM